MRIRQFVIVASSILLLILASLPSTRVPVKSMRLGVPIKPLHVAAFVPYAMLLWYAAKPHVRTRWGAALVAALTATLFGMFIEAIQFFIPYRSGRWQDLISNTIGITIGLAIVMWLTSQRKRRNR